MIQQCAIARDGQADILDVESTGLGGGLRAPDQSAVGDDHVDVAVGGAAAGLVVAPYVDVEVGHSAVALRDEQAGDRTVVVLVVTLGALLSGAVLETQHGTMQGTYAMLADDGTRFEAPIPAFTLSVPRTLH